MESSGQNNDPQVARTILANERTFLAWARTALGLISAGVAVARFLPPGEIVWLGRAAGLVLILLGSGALAVGYRSWSATQVRILSGMPIGGRGGPRLLAAGMAVAVIAALLVALTGNR